MFELHEILCLIALILLLSVVITVVSPQSENTPNLHVLSITGGKNNFLVHPTSEKDFYKISEQIYPEYSSMVRSGGSTTKVALSKGTNNEKEVPERYSQTNVQVKGIDEADIVKTDGKYLYLSTLGKTFKIKAYPPEVLKVIENISDSGNLYLYKDNLILITYNKIKIYNKSNLKLIKEIDLNGSYVDSRLSKNKLLLIVRKGFIVKPFYWNGVKIDYSKYYIPIYPIYSPTTYILSEIDLDKKNVQDTLAIVGSYHQTLYVSKDSIYFAYDFEETPDKIICGFVKENRKLLDGKIDVDRLIRICDNRDFGSRAKMIEINRILATLEMNTNKTFMAKLQDLMQKYFEKHINELQTTGIAKISYRNGLKLEYQIKVPGKLLNQFSMDEYKGFLRVATTIGDWRYRDFMSNNIYVIKNGIIVGKLENFEKGERIYAVRFMGNKAYVVTYKETDPLLVVDLSDPRNPKIIGKLKIPGYSTYLHPISKDRMIGIGKEGFKVKVSLFDVSDINNPKELDKFILNEYWSRALYDHHAFLYDNKTKRVVIPVGNKFYIFKINRDKIDLEYVDSSKCAALRALYFDNYIYDIFTNQIHVINHEVYKNLTLSNRCYYFYPYPPIYRNF